MSNTIEIDINLYDRQVRTYGLEAVKQMAFSSVLLYGLEGGLATEVGKNLALGGIKNIYLYNDNVVNTNDMDTGYYYSETDIGMNRSDVLAVKLMELNPYIKVQSVETFECNQNVTIIINQPLSVVKKMSTFTRDTNSKLIVLYSKGISGMIFVDAIDHTITDTTGETIDDVQITTIESSGLVHCNSHDYMTGDFIKLENMQGDNTSSLMNKEFMIKVINKNKFQLEDFPNLNFTFVNGTAVYIKKPLTITHQQFIDQIVEPKLAYSFDMECSRKIVDTYLQHFDNSSNYSFPEITSTFKYEIMPVVSLFGAITSSEAIKLVTNKYKPIDQWFTWTDLSLAPTNVNSSATTTLGKIYGQEFEDKMKASKWFVVGSGAIGCEHLKNMAFMNMTNIVITDPDSIEKSNLNRQFLFRSSDIGNNKSMSAMKAIKKLKPSISIETHSEKVGLDNMKFTDSVLSNVTGVLNALDNISARRFMDDQCFKFGLPLFESGTTGTKGNVQSVVPFVTETYSASSDPEQEKSFPMCTIKSFPNMIQHTIHWAMEQFFTLFNRAPSTMNMYLEKGQAYLDSLSEIEKTSAMEDIKLLSQLDKNNLGSFVKFAIDMFNENYNTSIMKLLEVHSKDEVTSNGTLFWSAGKRCPNVISFDKTNMNHMEYIKTTVLLLANICSIKITENDIKLFLDNQPTNQNACKLFDSYISQEFEKDDDTNFHVMWLTVASNMRAMNYSIPSASFQETKGIAGKIIPAIATTTAAVSGLVFIELIKYMLEMNKVTNYRSTFINLAEPTLVYSDPMEAPMISVGSIKLNSWTKFEYKKNTTLREFKSYYEKMFETTISMIVAGSTMIYADFLDSDVLNCMMKDIITEDKTALTLASDEEDKDIPTIHIILN
jgi:ubiquitin-activating enzyme E1